jgi:arsenate reductase-like glutaredoxin family protein
MQVQLFGTAKSKATRKAQRFFSERRVPVSFVDVNRKPPSPGELRRFVQRFGVDTVLDPDSKTYQDEGLRFVSASEEDWIRRMAADPGIIRLPLGRCGNDLSVGDDQAAWQRLAEAAKS